MANKYLGLDSINVLTSYIDQAVAKKTENSLVLTVQAYKYYKFDEKPEKPGDNIGGFDFNHGIVIYPDGWSTLDSILKDNVDVEELLSNGSIYMTAATICGENSCIWSTPIKISGQNGVSIKFAYSYDKNAEEKDRTKTPSGVDANHRDEWVWTKEGEGDWTGPTRWATYSKDSSDMYWKWCATATDTAPELPRANDSEWHNSIDFNLSEDRPYLWMTYRRIPVDKTESECPWSDPVLFGRWGIDGKNGEDGTVPDYHVTLYRVGGNLDLDGATPGIVRPDAPMISEDVENNLENFKAANPEWVEMIEDDTNIWWQCTLIVNGKTQEIMEIFPVKRYNAVDGQALPGQFTKYLYRWSGNQLAPDCDTTELLNGWKVDGWFERPDYDKVDDYVGIVLSDLPESSLWMISANANGYTEDGVPAITEWSNPIKITGPRGPIAYDYRIETRYNIGTSDKPKALPTEEVWETSPNSLRNDSRYPYVWAAPYLAIYKMAYDTNNQNEDGTYPVVEDGLLKITSVGGYFRVSGLDGEDGNKKNTINYATSTRNMVVDNFSSTNLYIANTPDTDTVTYTINYDTISFINGYTGKFSNIGKGTMKLTTNMVFTASGISVNEIILLPGETVELVCYNNGDDKEFLVIGKTLSDEIE